LTSNKAGFLVSHLRERVALGRPLADGDPLLSRADGTPGEVGDLGLPRVASGEEDWETRQADRPCRCFV